MRKLYTCFVVALMTLVSQSAFGWSFNLPSDNVVLDSVMGYEIYKYYDFFNGKSSPEDYFTDGQGNRVSGDGCLTLSPDKASFKLNGFDAFQVLKPVEMSNLYIQIGTSALNLRAGVNKDGLHNYGSGSRFLAIGDVKAGQIVVCQWGCTSTRGSICQPSSAISGVEACTWTDISEEIHAKQVEVGTTSTWDYDPEFPGDEDHAIEVVVPGTADGFSYWRAESDGYFVIELQRDIAIQGIQLWLDSSADEAISAPTMKLVGVSGDGRSVELTSGVSTQGTECTVWYGLEEDPALYLEDTDVVLRQDTIYVKDEEGNPTDEIADILVTYKQRLSAEDWAVGVAGSNIYDNAPFSISASDDTDGDGYVTVHAATVSKVGNFSDVVDFKIAVNEITLNAPTMTLVGLNGVARTYQLGWTNNTLCGESYDVTVYIDGSEQPAELGDVFEAEATIAAKVSVAGYLDGVMEESDVLAKDIAYNRKNADKAVVGQHDWDFVHLSEVQYQMIEGRYSDTIVYVRPNAENETQMDSTFYTRDEFYALVADGTLGEADGEAYHPLDCGWEYDGSRGRASLKTVEGGNDANANGWGYVEDSYVGLFNNGLTVSCAPNANNASCIMVYNNGDLGAYFMARPTLTFSREAAQYGEYVLIYQGAGGSNYTNSRWPSLYEVPENELLSVTLQNGGVHVFYIDVYTPEELPADGIVKTEAEVAPAVRGIYDLSGRQVGKVQHGIYIVNGRKVVK